MGAQSLRRSVLAILGLILLASGCGDSDPDLPSANQTFPEVPRKVFGGERPVNLQVPTAYTSSTPVPLLIILHGYGANGMFQQQYLRFGPLVESQGVLIAAPDGTLDGGSRRFWNATDACCNFSGSTVDDVAYIRGLIADIRTDYNVDRRRIYLFGHSNGGFMAQRLACEAAGEIAAIVSLAGATFADPERCAPTRPVSILNIHGDADATILYEGGQIGGHPYPSAEETSARWQAYNDCAPRLVADPTTLDVDRIPGNETSVTRYEGCDNSTGVELWTIHGGSHTPTWTPAFPNLVWQWLSAHSRPS